MAYARDRKTLGCAVVGTGAAALGVLTALLEHHSDTEITVFDIGERVTEPPPESQTDIERIRTYYDSIYQEIQRAHPRKFPPPKTHFAQQIARQPVGTKLSIFKSQTFGGLTNYWGATLLPFTDRELAGWPLTRKQLHPFYRRMAEIVGIAARADSLNEYFGEDYSTLPEIQPTPTLDLLDHVVNRHQQTKAYRIVSGLNRCAVQTRKGHPNCCIYCGECLAGCARGAIFSSRSLVEKYLRHPRVLQYIQGRVRRVDGCRGQVEFTPIGSERIETIEGYSAIFLCAGCPATTEIVMRSTGVRSGPIMKDNAVYTFPILYLGDAVKRAVDTDYFSLCNIILACIPSEGSVPFAQAHIYPNFDYLWRYNLPASLWRMLGPLVRRVRRRLVWARLYLHSDYSQSYACQLESHGLELTPRPAPNCSDHIDRLMRSIRQVVNNEHFYIPPVLPVRERTNSHYGGTIPFNGRLVPVWSHGALSRGVYVCDSSTFPTSPAVSPTFSIMANACRVATEVLDG